MEMNYFELLKALGINQASIARMLRVSTSAVSQWKRAGKIPPLQAYRINRLTNGAIPVNDGFFCVDISEAVIRDGEQATCGKAHAGKCRMHEGD